MLLSACVSTNNVAVTEDSSARLSGKSILTSKRFKPPFSAITVGTVGFGGVGAAAMLSEGDRIVTENGIEDPATYISETILEDLTDSYQLVNVEQDFGPLNTAKPAGILSHYTNADTDLILDIQTTNWNFVYFPTDWNNYRVIYAAKLRLLDTQSKSVIAEGFCNRTPEKTDSAPSKDELLADSAFVLKSELRKGANTCISEFRSKVLRLPAKPLADLEPPAPKTDTASLNPTHVVSGAEQLDTVPSAAPTNHPQLVAGLRSGSSTEMRRSAIEVGQQKIYTDEGLFLASLDVLKSAETRDIGKDEKVLIDGLAWLALNLGHSKDERARPVLTRIGANTNLPKKVRNHAIHGIKILDGLVEK